MTFNLAALLVTLANYSIASPDVIIDAAVTGRHTSLSHLQSISPHQLQCKYMLYSTEGRGKGEFA